jgi:acetoin utilization deacetylase AcuC-like enzyme
MYIDDDGCLCNSLNLLASRHYALLFQHCGNGTASIFYEDPTVLMISIHCHPDYDYPFHSGFDDEVGAGKGEGTTLHLPLIPGATWKEQYSVALERAMQRIQTFGAEALVISLGLDTHEGDPCAIRRAGFKLRGSDYVELGRTIGKHCHQLPTLVIQEGGYKMDKVPQAAADVIFGFAFYL